MKGSVACAVCEVCGLLWGLTIIGGCAYIVFGLGHSPWWFLLGVAIVGSWTCRTACGAEE